MEIEIRIMQSGDEALIAALEQKCFSAPWSEKMILDAKRLTRAMFYVAEVDGDFAGYAGMMSVLDEGNVFNIAADPKYRRCGVGTALTRALIKYSERMGLSVLMLEARESNVAARALYEKLGFENVGTRRGFYANPEEDAVLYNYYFNKKEI